ncbi:MAG TPA: SCO family protein [Myxococcaceae bacterium]|nr:SCO family protein [Myxococcaceae bacterium]
MSRPGHIAFILAALLPVVAGAQVNVPAPMQGVDVIEQLGDRVPEDGRLIDSEGQPFRLADELHRGKPVVLALVYYRCPQLCNLTLSSLTRTLRDSGMKPGRDYRAVVVSIDPTETSRDAAEAKRGHMQSLGVSPNTPDWRFATAAEPGIQALARATGFKYRYDPPSKQYAHPSVAFVLAEDGRLSRYLYGIEYPARDMKLALVEAGKGKVGTAFDRVLLTCFKYDPAKRSYGPYVLAFIRLGALLVFAALVVLLTVLWRQDLKLKKRRGATA